MSIWPSRLGDKVSTDRALGVSVVLLPDLKQFMDDNKSLAPRLQISSTDIDFTSFDGKSKKKEIVTLTNTGQSLLKISSMQALHQWTEGDALRP